MRATSSARESRRGKPTETAGDRSSPDRNIRLCRTASAEGTRCASSSRDFLNRGHSDPAARTNSRKHRQCRRRLRSQCRLSFAESSAALRAQGRLSDLARVLFAQGWAEMEIGDWTGAMREAEESVRFAEETDVHAVDRRGHDRESQTRWNAGQSGAIRGACGAGGTPDSVHRRQFPARHVAVSRGAYLRSEQASTGRPASICDACSRPPIRPLTPALNSPGLRISSRPPCCPVTLRWPQRVLDEIERVSAPSTGAMGRDDAVLWQSVARAA